MRVDVIVGTYVAFVKLDFKEDAPVTILRSMKTWTWDRTAPGLEQAAASIRAFLCVA